MTNQKAFTLLEIIAVIVIVALISTIIFSRIWFSNVDLTGQTEVLKTQLRYAQSRAMNANVLWGIRCDGNSYWLFTNGDPNDPNTRILMPGEKSATVNLSDKGIDSIDAFTIAFDDRGSPYVPGDVDWEKLDREVQFVVTSRGETRTIRITPNTGFIP